MSSVYMNDIEARVARVLHRFVGRSQQFLHELMTIEWPRSPEDPEEHPPDWDGIHMEDQAKRMISSEAPDFIVIGSQRDYHSYVEEMGPETNWTKSSTQPQFTRRAVDEYFANAQRLMNEANDDDTRITSRSPR